MTIEQKRKVLSTIQRLQRDIETLKDVRVKLASSEYVSASLSSGGGSKSYTRQDIGKLVEAIRQLSKELQLFRNMRVTDGTTTFLPLKILHVYGW